MAFGAGATGVDNAAIRRAKAIFAEFTILAKQHNGVVGALLGKVDDKTKDGYVQAQQIEWTSGQTFRVPVVASSETIGTVANQAAAVAARSRDALDNFALMGEFGITHFSKKWDIDVYDDELLNGDKETSPEGSYRETAREAAAQWMLNSLQAQVCTSQTQARATLGGLPFIVDDTNTYIGTRSDGAHTLLRSYVNTGGGALTLTGNFLTGQTNVQARGGWPSLCVLPTALHAKLHGQVINAGYYTQNNTTDMVGAPAFVANGTRCLLESGLDASFSGTIFLLNERDWRFHIGKNMVANIMEDPAGVDSRVMHMRLFAGVACRNPRRQGKMSSLT